MPSIDAPGVDASLARDSGSPGCTSDTECADAIDCTADTCVTATGSCRHVVIPALCDAGESCNPMTGCEPGRPCAVDRDCEDDNACTTMERCDPAARVCTYRPLDGDGDGDPPRVCGGGDCDDSDRTVFTGAVELCNAQDDDCDGALDNGADGSCDAHEICQAGACVCADGYDDCPTHGGCVDLQTTAVACGACNISCGTGTCAGGVCACAAGETFCPPTAASGGYCRDLNRDHDNCGTCGRACGANEECRSGVCETCATEGGPCCLYASLGCGYRSGLICDGPLETGRCIGCGGDGELCCETDGSTYPCTVGSGACESDGRCHDCSGGVFCGDRCAQLDIDPENCGVCGRVCPAGTTCTRGSCS